METELIEKENTFLKHFIVIKLSSLEQEFHYGPSLLTGQFVLSVEG